MTVGVIGYGSQGRAWALNLRDSGWPVTVGLRQKSKSRAVARKDGLRVGSIREVTRKSDIVCFAFPDHLHQRVFNRSIAPALSKGQTLCLLHGLSVHFNHVVPPKSVDVVLLAPHAPGLALREKYLGERDVSAFWAVYQNPSRRAVSTVKRLAEGIGISRDHLVKTTFEHEAIGDLFGEQAVLCGGLASLIQAGFDTLVKRGLDPDHAYLEVAYQLDLIVALIKHHGITGMFDRVSVAARFGSVEAGPKIIGDESRRAMAELLNQIDSGDFPSRLAELSDADITKLRKELRKLSRPALERAARKFSR